MMYSWYCRIHLPLQIPVCMQIYLVYFFLIHCHFTKVLLDLVLDLLLIEQSLAVHLSLLSQLCLLLLCHVVQERYVLSSLIRKLKVLHFLLLLFLIPIVNLPSIEFIYLCLRHQFLALIIKLLLLLPRL